MNNIGLKIKKMLMCVFAFFLTAVSIGILNTVFYELTDHLKNTEFFSNSGIFFAFCASIAEYACVIIILKMCFADKQDGFLKQISFYPSEISASSAASLFFAGFGLAVIMPYMITVIFSIIPSGGELLRQYAEQTSEVFGGGAATAAAMILTIAVAPVAEEIIFRGYLLNYLKKDFSPMFSVLFVSAAFAVMHGNPVQITYAFAMGVIITYFAYRFNNILYSVMIHLGFNFTVITTFIINNNKKLYDFIASNAGTAIYFCCGALILAASTACFFLLKGEQAYERHT